MEISDRLKIGFECMLYEDVMRAANFIEGLPLGAEESKEGESDDLSVGMYKWNRNCFLTIPKKKSMLYIRVLKI